MNKGYKILSIQYLRGLAALGVVFCHFGFALTNYPALSNAFNFGQLGVAVFFFISGFIIVYSLDKSGYKPDQFFTFLIKRSIRIDPPYWAVIALYIGLGYVLNHLPSYRGIIFKFGIGQFISHLFYAIPFTRYQFYNHIFWTLCVEFQFYVIIGLLYFLSDGKVYRTIFLLAFGAINLLHFDMDAVILNYSGIFAFGISFMIFCRNRTRRNAILPALFICLITYCHGITTAGVLLAACIIVMVANVHLKPLYFLGNISYSLYLTHTFIWEICNGVFKRIAIAQFQLLCFGIELAIAILFAWLFYLLIEKPAIKLSKNFIYQRTSRLSVKGSSMQTR
ncbi:MAG: acyltransferase [Bacteroidetes bacterium]|nr:acyltransferase [Bacteroidota bacterium]